MMCHKDARRFASKGLLAALLLALAGAGVPQRRASLRGSAPPRGTAPHVRPALRDAALRARPALRDARPQARQEGTLHALLQASAASAMFAALLMVPALVGLPAQASSPAALEAPALHLLADAPPSVAALVPQSAAVAQAEAAVELARPSPPPPSAAPPKKRFEAIRERRLLPGGLFEVVVDPRDGFEYIEVSLAQSFAQRAVSPAHRARCEAELGWLAVRATLVTPRGGARAPWRPPRVSSADAVFLVLSPVRTGARDCAPPTDRPTRSSAGGVGSVRDVPQGRARAARRLARAAAPDRRL